jgi:hypothetical protein
MTSLTNKQLPPSRTAIAVSQTAVNTPLAITCRWPAGGSG